MASEQTPKKPDLHEALEVAMSLEGSVGDTYTRAQEYSYGNTILLMMQGAREPHASYKNWRRLGRYVVAGAKGKYINRPRMIKVEDEDGTVIERRAGFLLGKWAFGLSDTEGDELPPPEPRTENWDRDRMLGNLGIRMVPFESISGRLQGYAQGRNIAISPIAKHRDRSFFHETSHVILGHTQGEQVVEYQQHRGRMEAMAELTGHLVMTELGIMTPEMAEHSRGYAQSWAKREDLTERDIHQIFGAVEKIVKAGRIQHIGAIAVSGAIEAEGE
jgi:hypothetical protein